MSKNTKPQFRLGPDADAELTEELQEEIQNIPDNFIRDHVEPLYERLPITERELVEFNKRYIQDLTGEERDIVNGLCVDKVDTIYNTLTLYEDDLDRPIIYTNYWNKDELRLKSYDTPVLRDNILKILSKNDDINLYTRTGQLGVVVPDKNLFKWKVIHERGLPSKIATGCAVVQYKQNKDEQRIKPELMVPVPSHIRDSVQYYEDYSMMRHLDIVLHYPYVHNNKLHYKHGYNEQSEIFIPKQCDLEMVMPKDSEEAIDIIYDTLKGFRFKEEADRENALAMALTPVIRPNLDDPPPLFCITAPAHQSGKSFLARTLWSIIQGSRPAVTDLENNQELAKKLFSFILQARPYVIFDNVESGKPLDSGSLASFITEPTREERLFYTQNVEQVDNKTVVCYTGTSSEASMELVSRMVQIRLGAPQSKEEKMNYQFDPIRERIIADRPKYLGALMYLVQKWIDKKCPLGETRHRQENWNRQILGILEVNGLGKHFLKNDDQMRRDSNPEFMEWTSFIHAIINKLGLEKATSRWKSKDVFDIASYLDPFRDDDGKMTDENVEPNNILGRWINHQNEHQRKRLLGLLLKQHLEHPFGGPGGQWMIEKEGISHNSMDFRLVPLGNTLEKYTKLLEEQQEIEQLGALHRDIPETDGPVTRIDPNKELSDEINF